MHSAESGIERWLLALLGAPPQQPALYRAALTHRSAQHDNNERLEFLGDAVLGMLIAEELYQRFPEADEGSLSRLRSGLVSATPLAQIGAEIGVGAVLQLGSGELKSGGFRRESILADAVEALIGATFIDAGLPAVRALVQRLFASRLAALSPAQNLKDAKTRLQELLQARGEMLPEYILDDATGEPHEQTFFVSCRVRFGTDAAAVEAKGVGPSRRRAEQQAAEFLLATVQKRLTS
jgi:ribonuclease III